MKYRKKPVEIEAMPLPAVGDVEGRLVFEDWLATDTCRYVGDTMVIPTLEGDHVASPGDFIIRGVKGELYPCKPDIFAMTYEPVAVGD